MKRKMPFAIIFLLLLSMVGCATMERSQSSLQDWRRSYLPTRQG